MPVCHGDPDSFELFIEGDILYDAMLESIALAQERIQLESYIFADDEIGWQFAEALAARAKAGVGVQVHLDAAGSLFPGSRRLERYLRGEGVDLRRFHRWDWRHPQRYNRRNHRKLLVVDERDAYLGGFNIHRHNSRRLYGEQRWRDTHVRLRGELVSQARRHFESFWNGIRRWTPPRPLPRDVLLPNYSRRGRRLLRRTLAQLISDARRSVYLTTPYFVPDRRTQRLLMAAARRGVDVRILVPRKNDVRLAHWAARAAYETLLVNGVRIFEYLPRVLHAKTAVADGAHATVGTANFDYRSFFLNYELNLFTRDTLLCSRLQEQFLADLREAEEIRVEKWRRRFWGGKVLELVGWAARRWL